MQTDIFAPLHEAANRRATYEQRKQERFREFYKSLASQGKARFMIHAVAKAVMCERELRGMKRGLLSTPTDLGETMYLSEDKNDFATLSIGDESLAIYMSVNGVKKYYTQEAPGFTPEVLRSIINRTVWEFRHQHYDEWMAEYEGAVL